MSLSTPVKKQVLEDILNSRFLRRKFKKEPTEFSIFFSTHADIFSFN